MWEELRPVAPVGMNGERRTLWELQSIGLLHELMWRVKEEPSRIAGFLMGRWWCHQLSLGVHGGKLVCWLGRGEEGWGVVKWWIQVWGHHESVSCQASEDGWLVVGHSGLKFSCDVWMDEVGFRWYMESWQAILQGEVENEKRKGKKGWL